MRKYFVILFWSFFVHCVGQFPVTIPPVSFQYGYYGYSAIYMIIIKSATYGGTQNTSNFPMLDSLATNDLKTLANGGLVLGTNTSALTGLTQPTDVVFSLYNNCPTTALLSWEFETYSATAGTALVWIQIPTLTYATNDTIYMGIGNPVIAGNGSFLGGATGAAWDAGFALVYHFPNGVTLSASNSTAPSNRNGTIGSSVSATSGKVDGAASFPNAGTAGNRVITTNNDTVACPDNASGCDNWNAITIEAWAYDQAVTSRQYIMSRNIGNNPGFVTAVGDVSSKFGIYINGNWNNGSTTLSNNTWYYLLAEANSTNTYTYVNAVQDVSNTHTYGLGGSTTSYAYYIGAENNATFPENWYGIIDEFRISKIARTSSYVTATYWNIADNAYFLTNTRIK